MKRNVPYVVLIGILSVLAGIAIWWFCTPITTVETDFAKLPGWQQTKLSSSFSAFKKSCKAFLKKPLERNVGTKTFPLKVKDWRKSCQAANNLKNDDEQSLQHFFKQWFHVVFFDKHQAVNGLFTGYYLPLLKGSPFKTAEYKYPIYAKPKDLISINLALFGSDFKTKRLTGRLKGQAVIPYFNRKQINKMDLSQQAEPLLWVNNRIDRFFLEIQGSGYVDMTDGRRLMLGYAAQNGQPYTPVGRYLISQGVFSKANASMQAIRNYLTDNPQKMDEVLHQNNSFIFFEILKQGQALGAQGVPLTPGYSLAVDRHYIPLGVPIWLASSYPKSAAIGSEPLERLMIAQDTGGAIKGRVRGDVFWGGGQQATYTAGHMKNKGRYWILLPNK